MKKAKLFLTGIAVVAIVGGAFAFNQARTQHNLFYCQAGVCETSDVYSTVSNGDPVTLPQTYYKVAETVGNPCSATNCTEPVTVGYNNPQ